MHLHKPKTYYVLRTLGFQSHSVIAQIHLLITLDIYRSHESGLFNPKINHFQFKTARKEIFQRPNLINSASYKCIADYENSNNE